MSSLEVVRSFSVSKFLVKQRRKRAANRIVRNGRRLRELRMKRGGITEINEWTEVDANALDAAIKRLERCRLRDIKILQTTPPL